MTFDRQVSIAAENVLVPGLAGAIGTLLISSGQTPTDAWVEVVGPSRIVAIALLVGFGTWLAAVLRHAAPWGCAVWLPSIAMGVLIPVEYWALALLGSGIATAPRRSAISATLFGLGAIGLHIALLEDRMASLVSVALSVDVNMAAAIIQLSGRAVQVRETLLIVDDGVSLRLIDPCSSIWPMLSVAGAIGSALGVKRFCRMRTTYSILVLAMLAVTFINALRLAGMSISLDAYMWLHEGAGATFFRLSILVTILAAYGFAALRRPPARYSSRQDNTGAEPQREG